MPKVTKESAVRPGLAPCPQRMGTGLVSERTCWPAQRCEISAPSELTPLGAPLHRWHPACLVGAAASRTAGTPKLGAVEPSEPSLVRRRTMLYVCVQVSAG